MPIEVHKQIVILDLCSGTLSKGCDHISADFLSNISEYPKAQFIGKLPPAPKLTELYEKWQHNFREIYEGRGLYSNRKQASNLEPSRVIISASEDSKIISNKELKTVCEEFKQHLNDWLKSTDFKPIHEKLLKRLDPEEEIHIVLKTEDSLLRQIPWYLWTFFDDYPKAELAIGTQQFSSIKPQSQSPKGKVRILAVLGNSQGLNLNEEKRALETLPGAMVSFLQNPNQHQLTEQLRDKKGWDILFFAGHSQSNKDKKSGQISINSTESLPLTDFKHALTEAISRGLNLAIFNSCDGLGLARDLKDLDIPQVIVMRELVPDLVAQNFFKYFLEEFSGGKSSLLSVRNARERLQGLENVYPCATWLPVICQNLTTSIKDWRNLRLNANSNIFKSKLFSLAIFSIIIPSLIIVSFKLYNYFSQSDKLQFPDNTISEEPTTVSSTETIKLTHGDSKKCLEPEFDTLYKGKPVNFQKCIKKSLLQSWELYNDGTIRPTTAQDRCLETINGRNEEDKKFIQTWECNKDITNQKWNVIKTGDKHYSFMNRETRQCMSINTELYPIMGFCNHSSSQVFSFK